MALPIANAGTAGADIPYVTWSGVTTRALADGGSTFGTGGASIASRQWTIISKPTGSTAALTGSTTATPTLTGIDMAGNYLVMLVVTDNLAAVSETDPFEAPASAFVTVRATTQHAALYKHAEGQRDFIDEIHANLDTIDTMSGLVGVGIGRLAAPRTVWVQAHDGDATADGSMTRPFNPISAAAASAAGPWAQAVTALAAMDLTDNPESGRTIEALPGIYSDAVSITAATGPWNIVFSGLVVVASVVYTTHATPAYLPHLWIGPKGQGLFVVLGTVGLGNTTADEFLIYTESVEIAGAVSVSGSFADTGVQLKGRRSQFGSTFNIPNLSLYLWESKITNTATVKAIHYAVNSTFKSITVTDAPTSNNAGYVNCDWITGTFTGPGGSAMFDGLTARRFANQAMSYAGGAGNADHLESDVVRVVKGAYANTATSGTSIETLDDYFLPQHLIVAGARLHIEAEYSVANNGNAKVATIAIDGSAVIAYSDSTAGAGRSGKVYADISITSTGSGVAWYYAHFPGGSGPHDYNHNVVNLGVGSGATIQARGTSASLAGEITLNSWSVTYYPAAA